VKKWVFVLLLAFAAFPVFSEEVTVFYVLNNTGFTIRSVYLAPVETGKWGPAVFTGYIYNGQNVRINLVPPLETGLYHIRLVDIDGDRYSKFELEIKDFETVEITIGEFDF
jgi:hypothetical protein